MTFINCQLPRGLLRQIDQAFASDPTRHNAAVKAVQRLYNKYLKTSTPFCEYIPISRDYKRQLIGTQYHKVFTPLQDAGIIEPCLFETKTAGLAEYIPPPRNRAGEKIKDGICKHYRFTQDLVYSVPELTQYQEKELHRFDRSFVVQKTVPVLQALQLDFKSEADIKDFLLQYLADQDAPAKIRAGIRTGSDIKADRIRINGTTGKRNTADVLEMFAGTNYTLVEYDFNKRIRYYLVEGFDLDTFVNHRLKDVYFRTYYRQLEKILNSHDRRNINCSRNATNKRLDHNLTNFKSDFLQCLTLDGQRLVSLDLKNSQFCIFGYALEKALEISNNISTNRPRNTPGKLKAGNKLEKAIQPLKDYLLTPYNPKLCLKTTDWHCKPDSYSDLRLFLDAVKSGRFYEIIAKRLFGLQWSDQVTEDQRTTAKKTMFEIAFDTYTHDSPDKELLRAEFPTLVNLVDGFKQYLYHGYYLPEFQKDKARFRRKYGADPSKIASNAFSIMLQGIEAEIFVDRILVKLLKLGFKALSKHDSILCKVQDLPAVETIVRNELDAVFGADNYQLEIEKL